MTFSDPQIDPLMDLSFHSPTTQFLGDEDRSVAHADPSAWRSSMILRLVTGLQSKQHSRPQNSHDTADEVRIVAIQVCVESKLVCSTRHDSFILCIVTFSWAFCLQCGTYKEKIKRLIS